MATTIETETIETTWELWTYDVWGNEKEGYEVNDRFCHTRNLALTLPVDHYNIGTPQEFTGAAPSLKQIRGAFGVRCQIETDGDDITIYVSRVRDSYPLGELICTSHESLSPIRK